MIEKLKTMVISRLQCEIVDKNNCLKMLILASKYDYYLENVQDYILSHLLDLLDLNEMLLFDKDFVSLIISDPKLSYISREECFKFLVKWIGHHPSRRSDFANLFSSLDVKEISVEILGEVDLGCLSDDDKLLCRTLIRGCIHPLEEVILMLMTLMKKLCHFWHIN